jgi:hypothetical protein
MGWQHIIFHATFLAVAGFFVAFTAQKATGRLQKFGRYLACWLYFLAVAVIVFGVVFRYVHGMGMMGGYHGMYDYSAPASPPAAPDAGGSPRPNQ